MFRGIYCVRKDNHIPLWKEKGLVIFHSICRFEPKTQTRTVNIRTGTKYAEAIGVKREWVHPWREPLLEKEFKSMYFDIAVMELGKFLGKIIGTFMQKFQ